MENGSILDVYINLIKDELENNPSPALILAAMYLMLEFDRSVLPDWVEAVANANPDLWAEAVDEIRRHIDEDSATVEG